jgi:cyclopropane fatty-acyl-phospholipid synthase-like methyltransferase
MNRPLPIRNWFDAMYEGTPPWDLGRPQPALMRLVEAGLVHGRVLDAGCGTGDLALELAARGHEVVGVDASRVALRKAAGKASERGLHVAFEHRDALDLKGIGTFDTVVDCGLFHVFSDDDRERYAASLARVLEPGGLVHLLCFSDRQPGRVGPRRVSEAELRRTFRKGWFVSEVREATYETRLLADGAMARLATIARVPQTSLVQ